MNKYTPVIGLEIHVELKTESKMFCSCAADWFGKAPNSRTCPVCLGLPGAIPVPNQKAIEWTIILANALNCHIAQDSKFDRKHYFYPDLPKSFQISQFDEPFGADGVYSILNPKIKSKPIRIQRVHLEEDTGKLIHKGNDTFIDYNRSGVPLVEIVTEPDFSDSDTVKAFLEELQLLVRALDITDGNMEEGSMRLEPNISLREVGKAELPNYKVEVKNINSFRFAKNAIEYELIRQKEILDKGETPTQETRGYNEAKGTTVLQRTKEEAHDYRYFPEPDIPPLSFSEKDLTRILSGTQETPSVMYKKFVEQYGIDPQNSYTLIMNAKKAMLTLTILQKDRIKILSANSKIAGMIINNKVYIGNAIDVIENNILQNMLVKQTDHGGLGEAIGKVISQNEKAVEDYKNGKESVLMFLVGQVMRELKGQADANTVRIELLERLNN